LANGIGSAESARDDNDREETIRCPNCGESTKLEDNFCSHCGYALKPSQTVEMASSCEEEDEELEEDFLILDLIEEEEEEP
jgi:predicted amidophosphoribosyltransferase